MTFFETGQSLAEIERTHILATLSQCGGNRTHAAKILKISVRGLRMKLQIYLHSGLDIPAPGSGSDPDVADAE
jgi:DNA-binding NtrC family response regulator